MKRLLAFGLALMMTLTTGCAKKTESTDSGATGENVLVKVNTEGVGNIAASDDGSEPVFDAEYPMQSAFMNVPKGTEVAISAQAGEGYQFVKWTMNGSDYSTDAALKVTATENMDFVAVFGMSSGFDGPAVSDVKDAKTIADVLPLPSIASGNTRKYFIYQFELNGIQYRAIASLTPEEADQLFALDASDSDYDQKHNEIVAPLAIDKIDNLTEQIPSQEELNQYVGKTGGDLLDEGWSMTWYSTNDMEFGMVHGLFSYTVVFEGTLTKTELEEDDIRPLVVKEVTHDGLGEIFTGYMEE